MFCSYLKILFNIIFVVGSSKNTKLIVDNLEDKCSVLSKEENHICSEYKLKKLVFNLKTNKESLIALDLDGMKLSLMRLQSPARIEGYDKNGKRIFSSESPSYCSNDFKVEGRENQEQGEANPNKKLLYYSKPEEKTIITKENNKYVLTPETADNSLPCFFMQDLTPNILAVIKSMKKKIEFSTNKDLLIGFQFFESFDDLLND
ncbi:putative SP-containing protein [Vairimorpha necatrix]|uniref:SP-containing protein n=1 Tax=Vairimorpha necatrix TaxID=6039 RepID=A0AAX4J8U2_9MICR